MTYFADFRCEVPAFLGGFVFQKILQKIKCNSWASCHTTLALPRRVGAALAIMRIQYFVSFASFLHVDIL